MVKENLNDIQTTLYIQDAQYVYRIVFMNLHTVY